MAVVLNLVEFSESSYIATLFTEDFGKITGLAKGARRRRSSFESALDLLSMCRVVFIPKTSEAMYLLTEASLERPFRSSLRCLKRWYAGLYVAELVSALTHDRDPNQLLFRITLQTLKSLDGDGIVFEQIMRFEIQSINSVGHLPSFTTCCECGRDVLAEPRVSFSAADGGALCGECRVGRRHLISVSALAMTALHELTRESVGQVAITGEMRAIMNRYVCHLLGRRPRMFDFLGFA
jgi:DNA repair protein RecO (recombination protein O)